MRAHAPGSVTTVFVPAEDRSLGVSFATSDGVVADVTPALRTELFLDGERASVEAVERLLADLAVEATVELEAAVPVGRGFGASGAATLATALAADAAFGLGRARDALVGAAHRAEVAAGTGLGDVFVQSRGGLVWDVGGGVERRELDATVGYESVGPVATSEVLADGAAMERVRSAGRAALSGFDPDAGLEQLFERSWAFARETGLTTPWVEETVAAAGADGGAATMAMVGETVVARGSDALAGETRVTGKGAALL